MSKYTVELTDPWATNMTIERERLMQLISRTMPTVPSVMADAILNSKWLRDHDARVAAGDDEGAWLLFTADECHVGEDD